MSGSTHVLCCLNDLRSTISVSCWLFHAALAAVTRGQRDLLERSAVLGSGLSGIPMLGAVNVGKIPCSAPDVP